MKGFGLLKKKLTVIFLLALALRLVWIATLDNTVDEWNEEGVKEAAWSIIQGRGYSMPRSVSIYPGTEPLYSWREPGFTLFLVPVFFFFGENYLVAKILLAILGSLSAVLLYRIGQNTFNSTSIGMTSALVFGLLPESVFWSGYLARESFHVFMLMLPILFLTENFRNPSRWNLFLAGFFLGLAALTRAQTILITPLLLITFFLTQRDRTKAFRNTCFVFLIFMVTFSPWVIRNYAIHHRLVIIPTVTGEVFYIANNPAVVKKIDNHAGFFRSEDPSLFEGMSEVEVHNWYRHQAFEFIFAHPKDYVRLVVNRFFRFWRFYPHLGAGVADHTYGKVHLWVSLLTSGIIIMLFVVGAFLSLKNWRQSLLLLTLVFSYSFLTILGRVVIRYRFPIMPYITLFAIYGIYQLWLFRKRS
ncbi:hypothetical protein B9J78_01285 [bacterium Unc6]|nr:hypothetical protein [bacterium Unc6]